MSLLKEYFFGQDHHDVGQAMGRLPLNNVRFLPIGEIARQWAAEGKHPRNLIEQELRLAIINLPRLAQGQGLLDSYPREQDLPSLEIVMSREDLKRFCDKQQWRLPRFWFPREERRAGRPLMRRKEILLELRRRAEEGQLEANISAQARALADWAFAEYGGQAPQAGSIRNYIKPLMRHYLAGE